MVTLEIKAPKDRSIAASARPKSFQRHFYRHDVYTSIQSTTLQFAQAARQGEADLVRQMLRLGADPQQKSSKGRTPKELVSWLLWRWTQTPTDAAGDGRESSEVDSEVEIPACETSDWWVKIGRMKLKVTLACED